jgi:hypothetical protein
MKGTLAIILVLLAAVLFPILIWVGLIVVVKEQLLRVIKQAGVMAMVFLTGILTPILIWVGLIIVIREPLLGVIKQAGVTALVFLNRYLNTHPDMGRFNCCIERTR